MKAAYNFYRNRGLELEWKSIFGGLSCHQKYPFSYGEFSEDESQRLLGWTEEACTLVEFVCDASKFFHTLSQCKKSLELDTATDWGRFNKVQ